MKPCRSLRESLALLACGVLPRDEAEPLHLHLQHCAGCRNYFKDMTAAAEQQATAARHLAPVEMSRRLHGRIASALRAESDRRPEAWLLPPIIRRGWLAGVIGATAVLIVLIGSRQLVRKPTAPPTVVSQPRESAPPKSEGYSGNFNLIAYRLALNQSPEALDQLLAREASRPALNAPMGFRSGRDALFAGP